MKKNFPNPKILITAMRITFVQLLISTFFCAMSYAHSVHGQEILSQNISLNVNSMELKKALSQIEKMTDVKFVYSSNTISGNQKVSLNANNEKLSEVLKEIFMPFQLSYEVVGTRILLKKQEVVVPNEKPQISLVVVEQAISGKVSDEKGEGMSGVSVVIKGTSKGTTTNSQGKYSLDVPNENAVLRFSFVGYASQEIIVGKNTIINVSLKPDDKDLEEVVVTGVFDKRTRMESSVAISTLSSKQIDRIAINSAADLLKNIPGVFVNSSLGEIRNTVYSRGVSVGSNDGASGYYYVSMQEDGLPVTNATFGNYGPDYFLRTDATLGRLEAVRGGTASILGNNAPGGIFNYVSKTGGQTFAGEVRAKYGLEGDGINPFTRIDANFGGPLSKDKTITYNVGGFWRQSDGARNPGYPMNNGGQIKVNIVKNYSGGSLKFYGKYLDDKNAWYEFLPTIGFTDPQLPAGVTQTNSVLIPPVTADFTVNQTGEKKHYDSRDKIHSKDFALGLNWEHSLGSGWTIDNKFRYSDKVNTWNTTAVAYPFAADGLIFYAVGGTLGQFGTYTFKDLASGTQIGSITQAPNIINGNFAGFNFIDNGSKFPGAAIQKNSLLFNPLFFQDNRMKEAIDQFTITKKLDNMSFTAGIFYANSNLDRLSSQDAGISFTQLTSPRPALTSISIAGFDGKTYQWTNPDGVIGGSGKSAAVTIIAATQSQTAFFLGHNWAITPSLNFDWGIRYETVGYSGSNQIAGTVASTTGGTDGNPLTLYDNTSGKINATYSYKDVKVSTLSFSGGLNYKLSENQAIYARYSQGNKAPDLDMFVNVNTAFGAANLNPIAQKVEQIEIGYKLKTGATTLFLTPFLSVLSNVPQQTLGQETADITTTYNLPVLYNKFTTSGIEIEANHHFTNSFSLRAVATFQSSTATEFKTWIVGNNGKADDKIQDFSGNETDNNASAIIRISPTYASGKFFGSLDFSYMGKRAANVPNAFTLPAFSQTNLNLGYSISPKLGLQANINNILNQNGVMGWSAPGGFPAALDRQGFTKASLEANPNAVYSTLSLPPRAFFLTATYKF
jgi:iron complex outermembrane recepter protein